MSLDFNICISADILPISCEGSTPASSNLCSSLSLLDFLLFALFCRLCSLVNLFPSGSVALVIASFSDSLSALKIVETIPGAVTEAVPALPEPEEELPEFEYHHYSLDGLESDEKRYEKAKQYIYENGGEWSEELGCYVSLRAIPKMENYLTGVG